MESVFLSMCIFWVGVGALGGGWLGDSKGYPFLGVLIGALLGPIGWILVGLKEPSEEVLIMRMHWLAYLISNPPIQNPIDIKVPDDRLPGSSEREVDAENVGRVFQGYVDPDDPTIMV